jgi:hypothetical protein
MKTIVLVTLASLAVALGAAVVDPPAAQACPLDPEGECIRVAPAVRPAPVAKQQPAPVRSKPPKPRGRAKPSRCA